MKVSSAPKARKVFVSHPRAGRRALPGIQAAHLPRAKCAFWWVIFREQTRVTSRERRSLRIQQQRERLLPDNMAGVTAFRHTLRIQQQRERLLPGLAVPQKHEVGGKTDENGRPTGAPIVLRLTAGEANF